jgi:hypothetical protein
MATQKHEVDIAPIVEAHHSFAAKPVRYQFDPHDTNSCNGEEIKAAAKVFTDSAGPGRFSCEISLTGVARSMRSEMRLKLLFR